MFRVNVRAQCGAYGCAACGGTLDGIITKRLVEIGESNRQEVNNLRCQRARSRASFDEQKFPGLGELRPHFVELAREQLSVNLAQMQEGRILLRQVEESRIAESDKWVAFYDAQYAAERARWNLARQTGDLLAVLH